ncbi:DUF3226 domain-containing protein [Desulfatibacillum aliphaticivorans]|uniref:DUF4276 family protein n=1 Tax=Desulfatibacillum aliphaticivorans TaxID=218208 RepID=B8FDM1_DESAL|nr:DUF3226 domain-containing protein [Desulfatibacillum aliphaticivorans]ACL06652.1 conserved hypothetical protein [Desulfatibacillum aliphaticivorans]
MPSKKTLWVEGVDDEHVIKHLCGTKNGPKLDRIKQHCGIDALQELLPVELKACDEGDIVAVIVDADTDIGARWQAIRNRLDLAGYDNLPALPDPQGTILDPPDDKLLPRIGLWIMPNNQIDGILEDFLAFLIPPDSQLYEHVIKSIEGIPDEEQRFSAIREPKARIHTWLAWQEEPGYPYGKAITAKFLEPGVKEADELIDWLNRVFTPE